MQPELQKATVPISGHLARPIRPNWGSLCTFER